jgi:hypothetical protein
LPSEGTIYGCDHDDDYFGSMVGFGRIGHDKYITLNAGGGELSNPDEQVLASMIPAVATMGDLRWTFEILPIRGSHAKRST